MANNSEQLEKRKQSILAAAQEVFEEHGYFSATVDEVAARAEISKGSVYNYFPSKKDLFWEVFSNVTSGDESTLEQIVAQKIPAPQKIEQVADYWFGQLDLYKRVGGITLEFWANAARQQRKGEISEFFTTLYSQYSKLIGGIVAQGIDDGDFQKGTDPDIAALLIMGFMRGIILQVILEINVPITEELLVAFKKNLLAGLRADESNYGVS